MTQQGTSVHKRKVIVIGSSAGGVNAVRELAAMLPRNFEAAIFVVQHVQSETKSFLPKILSDAGPLKATHAINGELITDGHIYVAPPDHHMLLDGSWIIISKGPKENNFRPSIDATMRSAAYWYGPDVIGVILTGRLSDGTSGLWTIKEMGGIAIVQDPADASFASMPESVLAAMEVDYQVKLRDLGALLTNLVQSDRAGKTRVFPDKDRLKTEIAIAAQKSAFENGIIQMGDATNLTCPECGGSLVSIREGRSVRYRCHTGHSFSRSSLWQSIVEMTEAALWQAVRRLEEGIILAEQAASQIEHQGQHPEAEEYHRKARELSDKSRRLLELIYN
ncbi:chemotaxis protein CheB [Dyadobacter sp. 676]|uniref:protein-glutamate methylesterase n=1 Tax=Dyadobacter sp. 676 TaxID=3088362 RepID=A0AAU8FI98_9BACT